MKIATWNLERPNKSTKRNQAILDCLKRIDADILILTETNELITFGERYKWFHSSKLSETYYKEGERRVSIYSKYDSVAHFETFRNDTAICLKFTTPLGDIAVYGTVIGIHGNRRKNFALDLEQQLADFDRIVNTSNICLAGDFNISFSDNYYYTQDGRQKLNTSFRKLNLHNLTAGIPQNIDHIVLSKTLLEGRRISSGTWNLDKKLSDHIGVAVEII